MQQFDDFQELAEFLLGPDRDWPLSEAERVWIKVWLYGIVVDDDTNVQSLGSYWNPNGELAIKPAYYVPDDFDTEVPIITIDNPNVVGVAWDARPL